MITLIPITAQMVVGRDGKGTGKRVCQLVPSDVTHEIREEEEKLTLFILSLWLAKGKALKSS